VLSLLRRPKWIIFTLLVPVGMVLCLMAADWQYTRHVNRSAEDARIRTNSQAAPVPLATVAAAQAPFDPESAWRPVTVTGSFGEEAVLVRRRPLDGRSGFWVVNPLTTADGSVLQVLRGWIATTGDALANPPIPAPPTGIVTVVGRLQPSQPATPTEGLPAGQVSSLDTAAISGDVPHFPGYLVAASMTPSDSPALRPLPVPELGLGPHLAYSWQWLFFAALLPVGWVILARRELQAERAEAAQSTASSAAVGSDIGST
jgi:cytochrome oxidase assembly protein ShyY1